MPIVDEDGRVLVLCAGADAEDWGCVAEAAVKAMEEARGRICWGQKDWHHRQGRFFACNVGISHGGGQTQPKVLQHSSQDDEVLRELLQHPSFVRMAGHASGRLSQLPSSISYS